MALTKCTECSGQLSDKAASCPHCGAPSSARSVPIAREPESIAAIPVSAPTSKPAAAATARGPDPEKVTGWVGGLILLGVAAYFNVADFHFPLEHPKGWVWSGFALFTIMTLVMTAYRGGGFLSLLLLIVTLTNAAKGADRKAREWKDQWKKTPAAITQKQADGEARQKFHEEKEKGVWPQWMSYDDYRRMSGTP